MLIHQTHMLEYVVHVAKSLPIKVLPVHCNIFWMISNECNYHFRGVVFFEGGVFSMLVKKKPIGKASTLCSIYEFAAEIQSNPIQSLLTLITLKYVSENRIDKVDLKIIIAD